MEKKKEFLSWTELSRRKITDCKIFDYYNINRKNGSGVVSDFTLLDVPDWVTVIAIVTIDSQPHFIMVKQFRHGSASLTVEFPAGMVEKGESAEIAAKREFQEETGYSIGNLHFLGSVNPNPAFMNNKSHFFLAENLHYNGIQSFDEHESVEVLTIPIDRVFKEMGSGEFDNGIMVIALFYYQRFLLLNK